jgi:transposase
MSPPPHDDPKHQALARRGVLHPHPELVSDGLFEEGSFFDRRDLMQVKYEMLRSVRVDGRSVREAASAAGLSRPTFYSSKAAFEREGLLGLLPEKKGPKRAHKLTDEILELVEAWRRAEPDLDASSIAARLQERLFLTVHARSVDRALARRRRKRGAS